MLKTIAVLAAAAVLTGCASTPGQYGTRYVPVVDLQGRDQNKYQQDLAECQTLAEQRGDTAQQALAELWRELGQLDQAREVISRLDSKDMSARERLIVSLIDEGSTAPIRFRGG